MFNFQNVPYKVKYGVLDSNDIYNFLEPQEQNIFHMNKRNEFFIKLEKSILKDGIRNPIMCWYLKLDREDKKFRYFKFHVKEEKFLKRNLPEKFLKSDRLLVCRTHGGCRLMIAQKYNLKIPCIISDFCSELNHLDTLKSLSEIRSKFKDKPREIQLGTMGVLALHLPHVHLDCDLAIDLD